MSRWLSRLLRLGPAHEVSTWLLEPDEERLVEQAGAEESEVMSSLSPHLQGIMIESVHGTWVGPARRRSSRAHVR